MPVKRVPPLWLIPGPKHLIRHLILTANHKPHIVRFLRIQCFPRLQLPLHTERVLTHRVSSSPVFTADIPILVHDGGTGQVECFTELDVTLSGQYEV